MNFTLYLGDIHNMLGMFLGPKIFIPNMFGYDVLWYYKPKKNQTCKKGDGPSWQYCKHFKIDHASQQCTSQLL